MAPDEGSPSDTSESVTSPPPKQSQSRGNRLLRWVGSTPLRNVISRENLRQASLGRSSKSPPGPSPLANSFGDTRASEDSVSNMSVESSEETADETEEESAADASGPPGEEPAPFFYPLPADTNEPVEPLAQRRSPTNSLQTLQSLTPAAPVRRSGTGSGPPTPPEAVRLSLTPQTAVRSPGPSSTIGAQRGSLPSGLSMTPRFEPRPAEEPGSSNDPGSYFNLPVPGSQSGSRRGSRAGSPTGSASPVAPPTPSAITLSRRATMVGQPMMWMSSDSRRASRQGVSPLAGPSQAGSRSPSVVYSPWTPRMSLTPAAASDDPAHMPLSPAHMPLGSPALSPRMRERTSSQESGPAPTHGRAGSGASQTEAMPPRPSIAVNDDVGGNQSVDVDAPISPRSAQPHGGSVWERRAHANRFKDQRLPPLLFTQQPSGPETPHSELDEKDASALRDAQNIASAGGTHADLLHHVNRSLSAFVAGRSPRASASRRASLAQAGLYREALFSPGVSIEPVTPGSERETLPKYSCTVHIEGFLPRKMEFSAPGQAAANRSWTTSYFVLHGTMLNVYDVNLSTFYSHGVTPPKVWSYTVSPHMHANPKNATSETVPHEVPEDKEESPDLSLADRGVRMTQKLGQTITDTLHITSEEEQMQRCKEAMKQHLVRSYSMRNAECGLAADYTKRRHVIRIRAEGEQFIVQTRNDFQVVDWIEAIQAAANITPDLETRSMPKFLTLPRRRRRRRRDGTGGSETMSLNTSANLDPSAAARPAATGTPVAT